MATSLLDLPAADLDINSTIDLDNRGTVQIGGKSYGQALTYGCSLYCNGKSPQVREVTLGRRYSQFTATATVLDSATGRHRIDIILDSQPPKTYNVEPGAEKQIALSVEGIYRMRIQLYAPQELKHPIQAGADTAAGKNGGGLPGVALADPLLSP